jgi:hypothetical protein
MPAASLGQYASLSFVVIGRRRNWGFRDFGFWILVGGPLFGRQRRLPYWILTPYSWLLTLCPMPYALCLFQSSL